MPLGIGLAIGVGGGLLGGALMNKGDDKSSGPGPQTSTTNFVDAATKGAPPTATASASQAASQAQIASQKQRKKTASGDTLLTPVAPAGGWNSGKPLVGQKAALIGS